MRRRKADDGDCGCYGEEATAYSGANTQDRLQFIGITMTSNIAVQYLHHAVSLTKWTKINQ